MSRPYRPRSMTVAGAPIEPWIGPGMIKGAYLGSAIGSLGGLYFGFRRNNDHVGWNMLGWSILGSMSGYGLGGAIGSLTDKSEP